MFDSEINAIFSKAKSYFQKAAKISAYKQISIVRNYLSMSQTELAKRVGTKQSVIAKAESGQNISLDFDKLLGLLLKN